MKKQQPSAPAPLPPLGPPHYRGPSGDVEAAAELVQRYQKIKEAYAAGNPLSEIRQEKSDNELQQEERR